jgi:GNAT superfamily N-acetyltransferase
MPTKELRFRVREGRRGDRDAVFELFAAAGVRLPLMDQSNTLMWAVSHPEFKILVAVDALDRAIGLLVMSHRPQLRTGGRIGVIEELVVAETHRRAGVATALLEAALADARRLGCKRIDIAAADPGALAFLSSRGFHPSGDRVVQRMVSAEPGPPTV